MGVARHRAVLSRSSCVAAVSGSPCRELDDLVCDAGGGSSHRTEASGHLLVGFIFAIHPAVFPILIVQSVMRGTKACVSLGWAPSGLILWAG